MSNPYAIAVVRKTVRVLKALAGRRDPATLTSLAREADLPKDQVYRILVTLQEDRLVDRVADRWVVGINLMLLGNSATTNRLSTWKE